jgi:LacI family transcriptional regulator
MKVPKVALFLENSRQYGRGLTWGIARYSKLYGPWTFYRDDPFYAGNRKRKDVSWIKKWGADGIITRDFEFFGQLLDLKLPVISASAFVDHQNENLIEIITDNIKISQLALDHFTSRCFKNFAYCGFNDMPWSIGREQCYEKILKKQGHTLHSFNSNSVRFSNWDKEYLRMTQWLKSLPKPIGILCCNDDRGCDLIEVSKEVGLKVPYDVAVLGVDNDSQVCELSNPPLSSICLDVEGAGFQAASILDQLMSGKKVSVKRIVAEPLEVVSRQSTDTTAINDKTVVEALQFIKSNDKRLIQVVDVINAVGCSRRGLDEKFKRFLRHSVFSEIRRVRTENIARMLIETDLSISQIAFQLGYHDADHIARFFRQEKKMTPQSYRKRFSCRITALKDS